MAKLVLIRHGQSEYNLSNRFTGWRDVDLTEQGVNEAHIAGQNLKQEGINFDYAYTSVLKRAIKTLHIVLEEIDQLWLPEYKSWRLNERHYGDLQGQNKAEAAKELGEERVHQWRRSYDVLPPKLDPNDPQSAHQDRRYKNIDPNFISDTENLKVTLERVLPFWTDEIAPKLLNDKNVIVTAHGNSLRALTKYLEKISDEDIPSLEIGTGKPIIYEIDHNLNIVNKKKI